MNDTDFNKLTGLLRGSRLSPEQTQEIIQLARIAEYDTKRISRSIYIDGTTGRRLLLGNAEYPRLGYSGMEQD